MGKLFGKAPSDYFDIEDSYINLSIDLGCALAHLEDENYHYKQSQETAKGEAADIERLLRKERENRG